MKLLFTTGEVSDCIVLTVAIYVKSQLISIIIDVSFILGISIASKLNIHI